MTKPAMTRQAVSARMIARRPRPESSAPAGFSMGCFVGRSVQCRAPRPIRSEEHKSELTSLMRNSYAVVCMEKNTDDQREHIQSTMRRRQDGNYRDHERQ